MSHALFLLVVAAFPLVLSPGPANLSLAGAGVAFGFRRSLPFLAGILVGTMAVLALVALGITAILLSRPVLLQSLKLLAAAYIVYLAWRIALAPIASPSTDVAEAPAFWPGLVLALANPKAFAAIGAVYVGHQLFETDAAADALSKVAVLSVVIAISGTSWLTIGAVLSGVLSHPRLGRLVNISFALLLVYSVGHALRL